MKYQHIAIYSVKGLFLLQPESDEVEIIVNSTNSFRAVLTNNPDVYCFEGDRKTALANLMLNLTFGQFKPGTIDEQLQEEIEGMKHSRKQKLGTELFLVFVREGSVDTFTAINPVEKEEFVVNFNDNGTPKDSIRAASEPHMIAALSAVILAATNVQGVKQVIDEVIFFREDNKPVYSYASSATATGYISRNITSEEVNSVANWYNILIADQNLKRVVRLIVSSLKNDNDILRAFLTAWMALEIFINKTFSVYEDRFFQQINNGCSPQVLHHFLDRIRDVIKDKYHFGGSDIITILRQNHGSIRSDMSGNKYRLSDKFSLVISFLSLDTGEKDIKEFMKAKKERDKLSHGQDIIEENLPVESVQQLTQKYLQLHLTPNTVVERTTD